MKTWSKTKVQGLMRHKSGRYYARLYVGDKEKWVSLKTNLLEVARSRMRTDQTVSEIQEARGRGEKIKVGKMTVAAAISLYKLTLEQHEALGKIKPSTREFWGVVLKSIQRAWPDLLETEVTRVTPVQCKNWAAEFAKEHSPTYTNNSIHALRKVFEHAIDAGALYRNPAASLERARVRDVKIDLPSRAQFHEIVRHVRESDHRTAKDAANTLEFLAYSGCRIGEARRVIWADCNLKTGELEIKGDPATGTKNWAIRRIPLIPALERLLVRMKAERSTEPATDAVLRVMNIRGSLTRACAAAKSPT